MLIHKQLTGNGKRHIVKANKNQNRVKPRPTRADQGQRSLRVFVLLSVTQAAWHLHPALSLMPQRSQAT